MIVSDSNEIVRLKNQWKQVRRFIIIDLYQMSLLNFLLLLA